MYNGTTFDPPIQMNYGYYGNVVIKANGRIRNFPINSNCWLGIITVDSKNTRPCYIKGIEDEYGSVVADNNFYYYDTSYPITFSTNKLSIETIDGVEGGITCTRQDTGTHIISQNYYAYEDAIPSNVSQLTNDVGYITASAIPSNISSFNNDVGYLSAVTWNDVSGKPNIPSNTSDLVNDSGFITANDIPAIPSKTSDLTNDSGFVTASTVAASYYNKTEIDGMIGSINTILDNINGEVI